MKQSINAALSSSAMTSILAAAAFTTLAVPAYAAPAEPAASESGEGGDIIVTARKRGEDILRVPVAVSALTSEDLAVRGIGSVNDVAQNIPGINISNISAGRNDRSFQQISLRGFTPSQATSIYAASFIDGVPVASATALQSVTDPERIEILKGPQAAYFGRNTFAGAINVVNKIPGNELSGSITAQVGTRNLYDITGSIEGAIVPDGLLVRLTGRAYAKDGSYVNQANASQLLGSQRTDSVSGLIVAKPTSDLTIKGFGIYSTNHDGPSAQGMLSAYEVRSNAGAENTAGTGTIIVPSLSNCTLNGFAAGRSSAEARVVRPYICGEAPGLPAGFSPAQNTLENSLVRNFLSNGNSRVVSPSDGVQGYGLKSQFYHLHLNIDWVLGDSGITLSSLTGYNNEYYSELADLDNYDSSLLTNAVYNPATKTVLPYWDFPFLVERATEDFSQELRASYDKGPLQATIGGNYILTKSKSDLVSGNTELVFGGARPSSSLSAPQRASTLGVFFGATYAFTDQLKLSVEGRYQEDTVYAITGGNAAGLTIAANNNYGLPPGTYGPLTPFFNKTFKNFLPRVILQYQATPDLMAYASWSKGVNVSLASFNTAFLNGSPAVVAAGQGLGLGVVVEPEKLSNYEVGLKGKFFDGKLRASLTGYFAEWTNQTNSRSTVIPVDAPAGYVPGNPCPAGYTCTAQIVSGLGNTGRALMKGIELDLAATPATGLDINIAASFNDSDIRSFADPSISRLTGVIDDGFVGKHLPATSRYSANLGIQYGQPITSWASGSAWFVRGDLSYKSKQYVDAANLTWIKGRAVVNMRMGISKGPASLEAFVTNLFNDRNYVSVAQNTVLTPSFALTGANGYLNVGLPDLRTFGLKAGFKF